MGQDDIFCSVPKSVSCETFAVNKFSVVAYLGLISFGRGGGTKLEKEKEPLPATKKMCFPDDKDPTVFGNM